MLKDLPQTESACHVSLNQQNCLPQAMGCVAQVWVLAQSIFSVRPESLHLWNQVLALGDQLVRVTYYCRYTEVLVAIEVVDGVRCAIVSAELHKLFSLFSPKIFDLQIKQ